MENIKDINESRVPTVIGVTTFMIVVTATAVGLRIYTRALILRQLGLDDWMAIFTLCMVIACGFCEAWMTRYGFGKHIYLLDGPTTEKYLKTFYFSIVFYNIALFGVKMTFLLQYYRILPIQRMRKVLIAATIFVGGWSLSTVFVQIFICAPVEAFWNAEAAKTGTCIPNIPQWYINAGGNILTDIMVLVLPLPIISKLKLHKSQKIVLLGIFCLGFFTCTISLVRIRYLKLEEDFTFTNVDAAAWSLGEISSGIVCACLPTLRPLVARAFPRLGASQPGNSTKSSAGYGYYGKGTGDFGGSTHQSRRDVEQGGGGGGGGVGGGFESSSDSQYNLTQVSSVEGVSVARDGDAYGPAGKGDRGDDVRLTVVSPSRKTTYLQTEICFNGRDRVKMPGKINVECNIVQVTSAAVEGRRKDDMNMF